MKTDKKPQKNRQETKKPWNTPKLTIHGDLEKITQGGPKVLGATDGTFS
jgi:hypothetical protein